MALEMADIHEMIIALAQTLYAMALSGSIASITGLLAGAFLFTWETPSLKPSPHAYRSLSLILNVTRSIPFLILMIVLIPLSHFIVGSAIGLHAAMVPLTIGAIPLMAQTVHTALKALPTDLLRQGQALGATPKQTLCNILLPEAWGNIVRGLTLNWVTLVGYASMAGALGGGGLGDFAIRYGYQRFDTPIMILTVILLYALVQAIQIIGFRWAASLDTP